MVFTLTYTYTPQNYLCMHMYNIVKVVLYMKKRIIAVSPSLPPSFSSPPSLPPSPSPPSPPISPSLSDQVTSYEDAISSSLLEFCYNPSNPICLIRGIVEAVGL